MAMNIEKYKRELTSLKGEYQSVIRLLNPITFGIEIEFAGIEMEKIFDFINNNINSINCNAAFEYSIWNVVDELTVKETINNRKLGGEIVSPILRNNEESWEYLKKVTKCFELPGFYFSDKCSFHVHFGEKNFSHFKKDETSQELCNPRFILNLFKIWAAFEDIIYRTCYGSKMKERPLITEYALPTGQLMYEALSRLNTEEQIMKFVNEYREGSVYGLNLNNIASESKKTIEIRCANAMETKFLMQNTVRFLSRLLQYCDNDNFDNERINYYLNHYKIQSLKDFRVENFEKALTLADMLFDNELDRNLFMKMYGKCFSQSDFEDAPQKRIQLINQ